MILSIYKVPGTILSSATRIVGNKDRAPKLVEFMFLIMRTGDRMGTYVRARSGRGPCEDAC